MNHTTTTVERQDSRSTLERLFEIALDTYRNRPEGSDAEMAVDVAMELAHDEGVAFTAEQADRLAPVLADMLEVAELTGAL